MNRRDKLDPNKRELPHSDGAEASILGGVILENEALSQIDTLDMEDFYNGRHKIVFAAIRNLEAADMPIDVVTLENEIAKAGKLEAIGGVAFLGELTLNVPTVDNVVDYADIVKTKRTTRDVMVALSQMLDEAYLGETEGAQLVHDVTTAMLTIGSSEDAPMETMAVHIANQAERVREDLARRARGELVYAGVPTGISAIDSAVGGNPVGIPAVYAARPGGAKTTLAMLMARSSHELISAADRAAGKGDTVLVSFEDGVESFGLRGLAHEGGLSTQALRARKIDADEVINILAAAEAAQYRREIVLHAAGMTIEALRRRIRRENAKRKSRGLAPIAQVIIDFIQNVPQPSHIRSRDEGIGYIMQQASAMGVQEQCALVVMCQLNRKLEERDDHEPRLEDMRESGNLEIAGKFIVGLHYPHKFEPAKYPDHLLELLILKNHQGAPNVRIPVYWDLRSHAIYNTEIEYQTARARRRRMVNDYSFRSQSRG